MKNFRSKSYRNGRSMHADASYSYDIANFTESSSNGAAPNHEADPNPNPSGMRDLRCYSASYASSSAAAQSNGYGYGQTTVDVAAAGGGGEFKKGKSTSGAVSKSWSFGDPELQRKKRVASYKAFTVEGKVKGSFKKSFRWIKERYTLIVHGYR